MTKSNGSDRAGASTPHPVPLNLVRWDYFAKRTLHVDLTGCILWRGSTDGDGYGVMGVQNRTYKAHRVAYVLAHGEDIPPGMLLDHRCFHPRCVNPDHLEVVTVAENNRRAATFRGATDKVAQGFIGSAPNAAKRGRPRGPANPNAGYSARNLRRIMKTDEMVGVDRSDAQAVAEVWQAAG